MDISTLRIVAFAAACATAFPAQALQSCRAASGPQVLPLVELYTSEGCDSCPPADRWLAKQFPAAATDARAVALAFHVDYWDRLGWADRFASPAYTERQYASMCNSLSRMPTAGCNRTSELARIAANAALTTTLFAR